MDEVRMKTVVIEGKMPLLMHADNIEWSDEMSAWSKDPGNKKFSKAGDDRTPAFRWIGALNWDDYKSGVITIPCEYIMKMLMESGAAVSTGQKQQTFKAITQTGIICKEMHWPLLVNGKPVKMAEIQRIRQLKNFSEHVAAVRELGFDLFIKRARIGQQKHVRVRPRFDKWSCSGEIALLDDRLTDRVLADILSVGGTYKGLGSWRPGGKTPGTWGTFSAKIS